MTVYYHGGPSGLAHIEPPCKSGARLTSSEFGNNVTRRDRVYVCTDFNGALMYAAMHPSKRVSVYTVTPVGDVEPDPDCTEAGLSFSCPEASIHYERKIGKELRAVAIGALLPPSTERGA